MYIYAHHPIQPPVSGGSMKYRVTPIKVVDMSKNLNSFRREVPDFRNARDWTIKKSL